MKVFRCIRTIYKALKTLSCSCFPANCNNEEDDEEEIRMRPAHAEPGYPWVLTMARRRREARVRACPHSTSITTSRYPDVVINITLEYQTTLYCGGVAVLFTLQRGTYWTAGSLVKVSITIYLQKMLEDSPHAVVVVERTSHQQQPIMAHVPARRSTLHECHQKRLQRRERRIQLIRGVPLTILNHRRFFSNEGVLSWDRPPNNKRYHRYHSSHCLHRYHHTRCGGCWLVDPSVKDSEKKL
jgi:hypothetical protein